MTVGEFLDVTVTLLTVTANPNNAVTVAPSDTNQVLTFSLTNVGNGSDTYDLTVISGPGFNPSGVDTIDPTFIDIYFDDGTVVGVFDAADTRYDPLVDNPTILADASITLHVLNNIGAGVVDGDLGDSELTATSTQVPLFPGGSVAGASLAGLGDGGGDLVLGVSLGAGAEFGSYLVSSLQLDIQKSSIIVDPFGGSLAIPEATITYTIVVEVLGSGTAEGLVVGDDTPINTTYIPGSMLLNGVVQTDAVDAPGVDDSDFDSVGGPSNNGAITVDLGDLTSASGQQTIIFEATIN